jgi:c-di-GMP phosphodiesterase
LIQRLRDLEQGQLRGKTDWQQILADPARSREALAGIRDLGVRISIDDFGTGFSSLSHIATQPIHALKIDRSFALNLMREPPLDVDRARSRVTVPKRRG